MCGVFFQSVQVLPPPPGAVRAQPDLALLFLWGEGSSESSLQKEKESLESLLSLETG